MVKLAAVMFENIKFDARRYLAIDGREQRSFVGRVFVLSFAYGFQATVIYRFGRYIELFRNNILFLPLYWFLNLFYLIFYWLSTKMYGIDICREAEIGQGFYIGHFGGVKVSRCKIGDVCNIHQLTKIGTDVVIGSYVWVGAHAVVDDNVVIEDHATVTVAAQVNKPVSSHSLVAGVPARAIKINFDNTKMLGMDRGYPSEPV